MKHLFLPLSLLLVFFLNLQAQDHFVNPSGACAGGMPCYITIQAAVAAASPGETIGIEPGAYPEEVTIDKSLTLEGTGANRTDALIDGGGTNNNGIIVQSGVTNVTIRNLSIEDTNGGSNDAGIRAFTNCDNITIENVLITDAPGRGGIYVDGPVDGVTITEVEVTGSGVDGRGIVVWNGFKQNVSITNCFVHDISGCCGIELQDGTASGVTMNGNTVERVGDSGMSAVGLRAGAGANTMSNNTITDCGRFGMEIKNPDGNGTGAGDGSIVIDNNTVSFTASAGMNNRDHAGIAVFRRSFLAGNSAGYPDVPTGVLVTNNTVSGYQQQNPGGSTSEGFGIVVEGTGHTVTGNTVNNCDIGIQEQGGDHPNANYVPNDQGDGDQGDGASPMYFGRGNAPIGCENTISGNTFSGNTTNFRQSTSAGGPSATNTRTGDSFCSIQDAIDDATTMDGDTLLIGAGASSGGITVNKELTLIGAGNGSDPASNTVLAPTSSCSGTGVTISTDNVELNNMYIGDFDTGVAISGVASPALKNLMLVDYCSRGVNLSGISSSVLIENTTITQTSPSSTTSGIRAGTADGANGFTMTGSTVTNNLFGIIIFQNSGSPAPFDNVTIQNSTISDNLQKGMYFEALSNALLDGLTMSDNGTDPTYGFNNGIDINLKYGNYSNITISNCNILNSGVTGTAGDPENPAAVTIKARDDAPSYDGNPATLTGVTVRNNLITGPENGIRFGEFGKVNNTPTNVTVEENNLGHGFANKALVSRINGDVELICNWHGTVDLVLVADTYTAAGGGAVNLVSILDQGGDNNLGAPGFLPAGTCCLDDCIPIPTMGQWALFLFGLLLFTSGVVVVYNMKKAGVQVG